MSLPEKKGRVKMKKEHESDDDEDPSGPSGAEMKGDNDYEVLRSLNC